MILARLEGLEPPAHGLEGRCSIQLSYRRMPAGRLPNVLWRIIQRNTSVSADRNVLYHRTQGVSTDFSGPALTKQGAGIKMIRCEVNRRPQAFGHEESPGTAGQGCRLTAGGGDSRESATEINRRPSGR